MDGKVVGAAAVELLEMVIDDTDADEAVLIAVIVPL